MKSNRFRESIAGAAVAALAATAMVAVPTAGAAPRAHPECAGYVATVIIADGDVATSGDDVILGTTGRDTILGYGGDDIICGAGGADTIDAGSGNDIVYGGGGHDVIDGGLGADVLYGQPGGDTIHGGPGNDRLLGGVGFDRLYGEAGNDFVQGSGGDDDLYGGDGDDALYGKAGFDDLYGGDGDDELYGAGGDDALDGGDGDDRLQGASGDDNLVGRGGADVLYGQAGHDIGEGGDGDDEIYGAAGEDILNGGNGDDLVQGAAGDDILLGGAGRDVLFSQAGSDTLEGEANTDFCYPTPGDLVLTCEGPASDMAALEALWASARADIVEEITAAGYGIGADNVLRGPAGFEVDLNDCPANWSNTAGIRDGSVLLAQILARSGPLAGYAAFGDGLEAYVNSINAAGGIGPNGTTIALQLLDDGYNAVSTQSIVSGMVASDSTFAITNLGSAPAFAAQDVLNNACVPQPFVVSGHQAWGDPVNHPWTTGLQLSYASEANIWADWIEQNLAGQAPVSVGAFVMDNDFGFAYEQAFEARAEQSDVIGTVKFVRHDPAGTDFRNEIVTIAADQPDVFISMTAGNPCLLAMQEVEASGLASTASGLFTPSVCRSVPAYLAPAGDAADGWLSVGSGLKDSTNNVASGDPFIDWMGDTLRSAGADASIELVHVGFGQYGWSHVETLRIAAELPGGLSRTNYLLAMRSLDLFHPLLADGVAFEMNGTADAFPIEGAGIDLFDSATQQWGPAFDVIDLNGRTPNCPWVAGQGC